MKYEIGSLVKLSARGKKLKQNDREVGGFGIITDHMQGYLYPYRIRWFYKDGYRLPFGSFSAKEYELRRMRAKKSK